jgi:integrase
MKKLILPKNPHKGLKIYCHKCKRDNPTCKHYDIHRYKIKVHIVGGDGQKRTKVLNSMTYNDAVKEAIDFENELKATNYEKVVVKEESNDYSILDAVIQYQRYLAGQHKYAHKIKKVSPEYQKECMRYCKYFLDNLKEVRSLATTRIIEVNQNDVARFYLWAENHYGAKSFNKCMSALKAFFTFLIDVEEIVMKNQFAVYESKSVIMKDVTTLTKDEFQIIIDSVGVVNQYQILGGKCKRKNMYKTYLVDGFKLFLLTGGRREDVVELRWSDIFISIEGIRFFKIANKKVNRIRKSEEYNKYIPINDDLFELLLKLGYEIKKNTSDYILFPERTVKAKTIMDVLSKSFSHYVKESGVEKDITLKNLRKTYISWMYRVMGKDTGLLTSHSGEKILKDHYIDSTFLSKIEEASLKIRVFNVS